MAPQLPHGEATRIVVSRLRPETLVVAALGTASFELFKEADRELNYYMWGGMGLAADIGLGLALAQPALHVVVLDGDGALMMNLGVLATVGRSRPPNLCHIVWDNESYVTTGGQPTGSAGVDLASVASSLGYPAAKLATTPARLDELVAGFVAADPTAGPTTFIHVKVTPEVSRVKPVPDPIYYKYRFLAAADPLMTGARQKWRLPS